MPFSLGIRLLMSSGLVYKIKAAFRSDLSLLRSRIGAREDTRNLIREESHRFTRTNEDERREGGVIITAFSSLQEILYIRDSSRSYRLASIYLLGLAPLKRVRK